MSVAGYKEKNAASAMRAFFGIRGCRELLRRLFPFWNVGRDENARAAGGAAPFRGGRRAAGKPEGAGTAWRAGNRGGAAVRRPAWLLVFLFLTGCASAPAAETPIPAIPSPTAETVVLEAASTASPVPPTPTPLPTATPDPYFMDVETSVYREGFLSAPLNAAVQARITGLSYPAEGEDCRVAFDELRYLQIRYVDFDGAAHTGELIVSRALADEVLEIFAALYDARYPLTSVRLVDDFGEKADDNRSMAADNTSSFCYRPVSGTKKLSLHSYGAAIDINPLRNPYVKADGTVSPPGGAAYTDRTQDFPGKIDKDDLCYRLFTERGWSWGGDFKSSKDYQHFSKDVK